MARGGSNEFHPLPAAAGAPGHAVTGGGVKLHSRVFQSPLAGVTDKVFRRFVRRYAPQSMMYTEMVNATGLHYARQLPQVMDVDSSENPIGIQLFDCRPDFLAEAARMAVDEGALLVDINMGCPVNKITRNGGGSSLLRDPETAALIVEKVVQAVPVPVTVKTRLGWSDQEINILEFARRLQEAGAQLLTLHGRTRSQGFNGTARWDWIARVKAQLSIPVIANGDIFSLEAAIRCLEETQADGVMCSRGTMGNPFLVGEIDAYLQSGRIRPPALVVERLQVAMEHLQDLADYKGKSGVRQARKHMTWYVKEFPGAAQFRSELCQMETVAEGHEILRRAIDHCQN
ncbi:MAG: tRNA dihydrouridine synthase DusB [Synechococcaceae cyanobacterium SM2_3_1]|nr:tRNA dihydrouridine synthase DusB [Synechococcaceae cyanobacterium SM2_3_1]